MGKYRLKLISVRFERGVLLDIRIIFVAFRPVCDALKKYQLRLKWKTYIHSYVWNYFFQGKLLTNIDRMSYKLCLKWKWFGVKSKDASLRIL